MNTEQTAFLKAVKDKPCDWSLRLVYADFLDECGAFEEATRQRKYREAYEWLQWLANEGGYQEWDWEGEGNESKTTATKITYEDIIQAGFDYLDSGDPFIQQGSEELRNLMYTEGNQEKYWRNWTIVTGTPLPEDLDDGYGSSPFSCRC